MNATSFIAAAYNVALNGDPELHKKWISISFKLGPIAGNIHTITSQRLGRLDLLLRMIENERLELMRLEPSDEIDLSLDMQFSLSTSWLFLAYEVARAAKKPLNASGQDASRLLALEHRLALVRMPLAKGVIQGMNRKPHKNNPPVLVRPGDKTSEVYEDDGSYVMPHGICGKTGASLWCPADVVAGQTVAICRRDLSDEMLALFD